MEKPNNHDPLEKDNEKISLDEIDHDEDEFFSLTKELDRLEELAKASPYSLVRLGDALFWEFKPRLDKIMLDVQNIVVSSITKEDKR